MPVLLEEQALRAAVTDVNPDILIDAISAAQLFAAAQADVVATMSAVHLAALLASTDAQPPFQPNKLQVPLRNRSLEPKSSRAQAYMLSTSSPFPGCVRDVPHGPESHPAEPVF